MFLLAPQFHLFAVLIVSLNIFLFSILWCVCVCVPRYIILSKWYKFIYAITVNIGQDICLTSYGYRERKNGCYNHLIHVLLTVTVLLLESVNVFNLSYPHFKLKRRIDTFIYTSYFGRPQAIFQHISIYLCIAHFCEHVVSVSILFIFVKFITFTEIIDNLLKYFMQMKAVN